MAHYLFIDSRGDTEVLGLVDRGHTATVLLVQGAVSGARPGAAGNADIEALVAAGVTVLVDDLSAEERSLREVVEGAALTPMDEVIPRIMEPGTRVVWR